MGSCAVWAWAWRVPCRLKKKGCEKKEITGTDYVNIINFEVRAPTQPEPDQNWDQDEDQEQDQVQCRPMPSPLKESLR